ncbi:MAG: hypothetical protein ACI80K_004181, partial [Paracoccaceae bacterium]
DLAGLDVESDPVHYASAAIGLHESADIEGGLVFVQHGVAFAGNLMSRRILTNRAKLAERAESG